MKLAAGVVQHRPGGYLVNVSPACRLGVDEYVAEHAYVPPPAAVDPEAPYWRVDGPTRDRDAADLALAALDHYLDLRAEVYSEQPYRVDRLLRHAA